MKWGQWFPNDMQLSENILKNNKEELKENQTSVDKGHGYSYSLATNGYS